MHLTWSRFTNPLEVSLRILLIVIALLLGAKWVRVEILHSNAIQYYPKFLHGQDADLAIVMSPADQQAFRDGRFTLKDYASKATPADAFPGRSISNWTNLRRLAAELDSVSNNLSALPKQPISYWALPLHERFGQAMVDRIDDFPFVNATATFLFGLLLAHSIRKLKAENRHLALHVLRISPRDRNRSALVGLLIWVAMQLGHALGDVGPLHGSLWTEPYRLSLQGTQWFDAVLYVVLCWLCGYYVILYWRLLHPLQRHPDWVLQPAWRQIFQDAVNAGIRPLLIVVVTFLGVLFGTKIVQTLPVSPTGYMYTLILYLLIIIPAACFVAALFGLVPISISKTGLSFSEPASVANLKVQTADSSKGSSPGPMKLAS